MRLIVGVSGASGAILAENLLHALRSFPAVETHMVMTEGAQRTLHDPFAQKDLPWKRYAALALFAILVLFLLQQGHLASWARLLF